MATTNFIEQEAAKDPVLTNSLIDVFAEAYPDHPADAVVSGNLLSAATQTFAQLSGAATNIPYGKQITVAITLTSGTVLNYGIELSKDPNDPQRANITGVAGATISVLAAEWLTGLATGLAGAAVAAGASPVLVTIAAAGVIVGASYYAGNLASVVAGHVYDLFVTPNTKIQENRSDRTRNVETTLSNQGFIDQYGNVYASDAAGMTVNGLPFVQWWTQNSLQDLIDNSTGTYRSIFTTALTSPAPRRDPLILDLDNDGAETIGVESGAHFDHDANGFAEQTGWVSPDDGLLVRDINGNGTIDTGRELFGDNTLLKDGTLATDGLQALADLDDNGDNKIDSQDAAFSQLKVWKDLNSDGISTADELKTLDELNIKSLNTTYTVTNITDSTGNTQTHQATYEKKLLMENS